MSNTLTTLDGVLKELYPDLRVKQMIYSDHPVLEWIPKDENAMGDSIVVPVSYGSTNRRSASFSVASALTTGESVARFVLSYVQDYSFVSIDGIAIDAGRANRGSFVNTMEFATNGAIFKIENSLASAVCGSSTGVVAQISSGSDVGTSTITLADPETSVHFETGDVIRLSATDGAAAEAGTATITGVDRDAGTLSFAGALTAEIATAAASYFIQLSGDTNAKLSGLENWLDPNAAALGGVTRTVDATRLSGIQIDASALSAVEGIYKAALRVAREGGRPDAVVLNHKNYEEVVNELQTQLQFTSGSKGEVGFNSVVVNSPAGPLRIMAERYVKPDVGYVLTKSTWKLHSMGMAPKFLDRDGTRFLRDASTDSYSARLGYYAQLSCSQPGWNARISF